MLNLGIHSFTASTYICYANKFKCDLLAERMHFDDCYERIKLNKGEDF